MISGGCSSTTSCAAVFLQVEPGRCILLVYLNLRHINILSLSICFNERFKGMSVISARKRRLCWLGFAVLPAVLSLHAQEQVLLVEHTDNVRQVAVSVMTQAEYQTLQAEIMAINTYISRGLTAAKKEWRDAADTKDLAFPAGIIGPAKVRIMSLHGDKAKADAALAEITAQSSKEAESKTGYLQKRIDALRESLKNPPSDSRALSRKQWIAGVVSEIEVYTKELAAQEQAKAERERIISMAKEMLLKKIAELRAGPPSKQ
jgi:hypothetical protein